MRHNPIKDFDEARRRGFSAARSARWAAYVMRKRSLGQPPISLDEAERQVVRASVRSAS